MTKIEQRKFHWSDEPFTREGLKEDIAQHEAWLSDESESESHDIIESGLELRKYALAQWTEEDSNPIPSEFLQECLEHAVEQTAIGYNHGELFFWR